MFFQVCKVHSVCLNRFDTTIFYCSYLCHTLQVGYVTESWFFDCVVPPAYYAHLAAFRARYYIEGGETSEGGSASVSRGTNVEVTLPSVMENVKEVMFFCWSGFCLSSMEIRIPCLLNMVLWHPNFVSLLDFRENFFCLYFAIGSN